MRLSRYFLPTIKENPAEAQILSHRFMLRAGMIRQASSGIYSWLPLGFKVLEKIKNIVSQEQNAIGCQEMLMPTIQTAEIWKSSDRYDSYGPEMLRIKDRHDRDMLYGPTNEEQITEIIADSIRSYKELPQLLYHIQWKFRDEVRPRFGVMRGREFLMKDAYSFDLTPEDARKSYNKFFISYLRTFERLGLKAIPMIADTGPIGGDLSHEFLIIAPTGESEIACHKDFLSMKITEQDIDFEGDLQRLVDKYTNKYAATDEKRNLTIESSLGESLIKSRGIEVGHIFNFGTKYSKAMGASVANLKGESIPIQMGSYGIGISRLVGAIIESSHDDNGIIWPHSIAPFKVQIINLGTSDLKCTQTAEELYNTLRKQNLEPLYDDRDTRAGNKFADADLIGTPWQLIISPRGLKNNLVELKKRQNGERDRLSISSALSKISN